MAKDITKENARKSYEEALSRSLRDKISYLESCGYEVKPSARNEDESTEQMKNILGSRGYKVTKKRKRKKKGKAKNATTSK